MFFNRRKDGGTAVAERPEIAESERLRAQRDLAGAIALLEGANRASRDAEIERAIREVRHEAGEELVASPPADPTYVTAARELPSLGEQSRVPEIGPAELTPQLLRGAILEHGCLLVRGLMSPDRALGMADDIDRSIAVRSAGVGAPDPDGYYDEFQADSEFYRGWIEEGGGFLACDSPRLLFEMIEVFRESGVRDTIEGYLGEPPALSGQKCTMRKATPEVRGAWHQDGKFLGEVRALNVWVSLSRCGDVAPSMDIVPRRVDEIVEVGTDDATYSIEVSQARAEQVAGEAGIVRPIFEPGDALLFDEKFLHKTGSDPSMSSARYAIESWFFGPSAYPADYVPIAP